MLLMVGQEGPDYLRRIGQAIAQNVTGSQFESYKGMDHNGPLFKPVLVANRLRNFFAA